MKHHVGALASAGIGIWGCISSFVNMTHHGNVVKSLTGYNTPDGKIFLIGFIILAVLSFIPIINYTRNEGIAILNFIGGILIGIFAYRDLRDLNTLVAEASNVGASSNYGATIGVGLFLVLGGAIFIVINSIFDVARKPKVVPVKNVELSKVKILITKFDIYCKTMSKEDLISKLTVEGHNKDYLYEFYDWYAKRFPNKVPQVKPVDKNN